MAEKYVNTRRAKKNYSRFTTHNSLAYYDGPTQVSGEDDLPEEGGITTLGGGEDIGGSSSDGETIEEAGGFIVRVDDTEFSDDDGSTNSSGGAGGGGEASGMGPKMCSLNPNAGNTYAPWILGWWMLTTAVILRKKCHSCEGRNP